MDAVLSRGRRGLPYSRAAIVVVLVVAALLAATARTAAASPNDGFFGVNPGDLFKLPQSQWDAQLAQMEADGIQVVRLRANWSDLEPAPPASGQHTYYWGDIDQQVAALARHGLRAEPLLSFSPTWESQVPGDYTAAPASAGDFAAFAAALAQRYGQGGSFWHDHPDLPALPATAYEIWNEPNAAVNWHPAQNGPEAYADLYAAARNSIHQVDGSARVLVGGLGIDAAGVIPADQFVERMLAHRPDLHGNIDAVALHPYARDVQGVYARLASFRQALDAAAGPGVPIEVTEIGWTTVDVSEQQRAADLAALATTLPRSDCGIERMSVYDWIGPELAAGDREQWFGIENADATPKPAAAAYADAIKHIRGLAGSPPGGTAAICNTSTHAVTATTRPAPRMKLQLQVRRDPRNRARILVAGRCSTTCRLTVDLFAPARAGRVRAAHRSTRFATGDQAIVLRVAHRSAKRATVRVTATAQNGQRETVTRTVRLR